MRNGGDSKSLGSGLEQGASGISKAGAGKVFGTQNWATAWLSWRNDLDVFGSIGHPVAARAFDVRALSCVDVAATEPHQANLLAHVDVGSNRNNLVPPFVRDWRIKYKKRNIQRVVYLPAAVPHQNSGC